MIFIYLPKNISTSKCRRNDFNVGESTQIVKAKRLDDDDDDDDDDEGLYFFTRRNDLDVGESTCRRNDL